MRANSGNQRRRRLAAAAAAGGAILLLARTAAPTAASEFLSALLADSGLAGSLLTRQLPGASSGSAGLSELVLEQLPDVTEAEGSAADAAPDQDAASDAPSEASEQPETAASETEEDSSEPSLPTSGLLEAPETEDWSGSETEDASGPDWSDFSHEVEPEDLELTNSTDGIELTLGDYLAQTPALTLSSDGPQILIMHTHGTEAYTIADGDDYTPSDTARTTDENYNMLRVGAEIQSVLESLGLGVVHDTTLYDYPSYTGSYARSLEGIQAYLEEYPTISVVLDVHRDALIGSDGTAYKVTDTLENGETIAQVMLVVGTDDGGLEHPDWQDNLTLAAHIQAAMLALDPGLPRAVNLRSQRFNQHMTAGSLLVEVGTSGNTLQEALAGARAFARAAGKVYLERMEEN